jgi:hypothetical protein
VTTQQKRRKRCVPPVMVAVCVTKTMTVCVKKKTKTLRTVAKMIHKEERECFYCDEVYKIEDHTTCPNCAVNTDTKGIKIIELGKEDKNV